ncbi:hypothetical protein N0V83_007290 [Neocucurbitaria cava]|uniref:Uncharacterized protein n=1 Tax=Neocucurbitaria cava TaxID=798079 RepID=A0A9W8Y3C7_9PLEO|nr:hypothetical protein N0V83_007290 [Neocucurbitaria cava]
MLVPAYCPIDFGVHAIENSGVREEAKNVMAMESMPAMSVVDDDISIPVELGMDIPDIVLVGALALDIDMPDISMVVVKRFQSTL